MKNNIIVLKKTPEDKKWLKKMHHFQEKLYDGNKNFVSHLKMDVIGGFGQKGMLEKENPFHKKADVVYFIAMRNHKVIGTISATINFFHDEVHNEKMGFFGCFEVINEKSVAHLLFDHSSQWLKEKGAKKIRGPFNLDINGMAGLLIDSFDKDPVFHTTYNFEYYIEFITSYGFSKVKDMYAQLMPIILSDKDAHERRNKRIQNLKEYVKKRFPQIRMEYFNFKDSKKHLSDMKYIFNESWKNNWGYVPLLDEEFNSLAESLRIIADRKLVMISYINDKPASVMVTIPDINIELKKRRWLPQIINLLIAVIKTKFYKIKRVRLLIFGVVPEYRKMGLDSWSFAQSLEHAINVKYKECELSWLLEDNTPILRAGEKMGAEIYKTWRIFEKNL